MACQRTALATAATAARVCARLAHACLGRGPVRQPPVVNQAPLYLYLMQQRRNKRRTNGSNSSSFINSSPASEKVFARTWAGAESRWAACVACVACVACALSRSCWRMPEKGHSVRSAPRRSSPTLARAQRRACDAVLRCSFHRARRSAAS